MAFLCEDAFDADSFIEFLTHAGVRSALLKASIPDGENATSLRNFLREANGLSDQIYRQYVAALPKRATSFPKDLEPAKRLILVEECGVTFRAENFSALSDDASLQVIFVAKNIESYLRNPTAVSIDDDFRERLLATDIADEKKRAVIGLMDLSQLAGRPERAAVMAQVLARTDTDVEAITFGAAQALIIAAKPAPVQIKLFNALHQKMDVPQVRETLQLLPRPYSEITTGYGRPQLSNSGENRALVNWLNSRNIISSFSKAWWGDDIVVHLYRK